MLVVGAVAQPDSDGANAASPNGKVLRLEEAIQTALEKNLQLRAAQKGASAASWGVKNAHAQFLPTVNIGVNYLRVDAERYRGFELLPEDFKRRLGAYRNTYTPSVTVTQPIFNGGSLLANVGVAQAQDLTAQADLNNTEQRVIYDTQYAYFVVLRAQELYGVAKENLQTVEEHLNSARKQVEAGLRSKTEILRWEVQKANAENFLAQAEHGLTLALPALNQVLGLDLNTEYAVASVEDVQVEIPPTVDEQIATAMRKNPGIYVMEANLDLAGAQVKAERAHFLPSLNLAYTYSWETNPTVKLDGFKTWSLGIIAEFPIFNGFRDYTNLQKAQEVHAQTQDLQKDFERGLHLQILQASQNLDLAKKQVVLTEKAKEQAEENFRVIKHSYEVGLASNLDFLDAQRAQNQARWDNINAKYDFLLSKTALAQAMGVLRR
jgi:TolC family type I secretion outer membrane protein